MWRVATTDEFDRWFRDELTDEEREETTAKVNLIKVFGPQLGRPHADTLNGSRYANMKELRAKTSASELRVAFAFDPTRAAVLLVGGNKAGVGQRKLYQQLIDRADALFAAHLAKVRPARKKGKGK
jgi:hypothetical protein